MMIPYFVKKINRLTQRASAFTLMEVAFVMLIFGVLVLPVVTQQNQFNGYQNMGLQDLSDAGISSIEIAEVLKLEGRRKALINETSKIMMQQGSMGRYTDANISSYDDLFNLANTFNTGNFYNARSKEFNLTNHTTPMRTFYMAGSDGRFVPLFNYQWRFENNANLNPSTTMTDGSILMSTIIMIYEVNNASVANDSVTIPSGRLIDSITTNSTLQDATAILEAKSFIGGSKVLVNLTIDLSETTCFSPATKSHNARNDYTPWTTLNSIAAFTSNGSEGGYLCAPYLNSSPNVGTFSSGTLRTYEYDIYANNGSNRVFIHENTTPAGSRSTPVTVLADMIARPKVGGTYDTFGPTQTLTYRVPHTSNSMPFPEGDLSSEALNTIRCNALSDPAKNIFDLGFPKIPTPLLTAVEIPFMTCGGIPSTQYSRFFVENRGVGGDPNTTIAREAARMPFITNYSGVNHPQAGGFDNREPHRYISGAEMARSMAFTSIFDMRGDATLRDNVEVTTILNHGGGASGTRTTAHVIPNAGAAVGATLDSANNATREVLRHLYSINRPNAWSHLPAGGDLNLTSALRAWNETMKGKAVNLCQSRGVSGCGNDDVWIHHDPYKMHVNIMLITGDLTDRSENSTVTNHTAILANMNSIVNNNVLTTIMADTRNGAFPSNTRHIIVYVNDAFKSGSDGVANRLEQLATYARTRGLDVKAYGVSDMFDYQELFQTRIMPILKEKISTPTGEDKMYSITSELRSNTWNY